MKIHLSHNINICIFFIKKDKLCIPQTVPATVDASTPLKIPPQTWFIGETTCGVVPGHAAAAPFIVI